MGREMEEKIIKERGLEFPAKGYQLLSLATEGKDITVRDDQYDFSWLLDAIKHCRKRSFRFRLIDSGQLKCSELEWLVQAGADLYTSDEARPNVSELRFLSRVCKRGKAIIAYFHHGSLEEESGDKASSASFSDLKDLGASGFYLHLSNKEEKRAFSHLNLLASICHQAGSWLVYYHHGPLEPYLDELGVNGAWIHLSDKSLKQSENNSFLLDIIKSARSAGANLILHLEKGLDFSFLRDIVKAGAFILFEFSLFDFKSPFLILEKETKRKKLDFRAFYLYPHFLL